MRRPLKNKNKRKLKKEKKINSFILCYCSQPSERAGFVQRDVKAGECNTKFNVASDDLEYTNILNLYEESDDGTGTKTTFGFKKKLVVSIIKLTMNFIFGSKFFHFYFFFFFFSISFYFYLISFLSYFMSILIWFYFVLFYSVSFFTF